MAKLEGNKWFVEKVEGKTDIVVNVAEAKQGVFISQIKDSVVTIVGKCSAISIESAVGSGIIFDDVVATVEVINSKKVQLQANGALNQIQIDKTNGATIYLQTAASQGAQLVTSLSSELNIVLPGATEEDDAIEHPVPEQYVSKFVDGKLVTGPTDHV
eukprot:TRINITY_DN7_c6_g1_i1.p2 TRINITY_DN7_c6_g1~~TRINITY_DN7_c6_g1_i1.p2  ORF type:complete len:158 (-),score=52.56 TRINITY_DN7_c6_g1_i1:131-604(-)